MSIKSNLKLWVASLSLLALIYAPTSMAALQCFSQAGTYGNITVTETGSGCGLVIFYTDELTGLWMGDTNSDENCQFNISPAVDGSTVEVRMGSHDVSYPTYADEVFFSMNGSFVAVTNADIDNSFPTGGGPLLASTGGPADPTVGGVTAEGPGRGTVRFGAAPDSVSSINIQHNHVIGGPNGTIYEVCVEDESSVVEPDTTARFTVTKNFSDDNPAPVEVHLTCDAGLPLTQSFAISDDDTSPVFGSVTFVVDHFQDGTMSCTVTETPTDGYSVDYTAGGDSTGTSDTEGCYFSAIGLGDTNTCSVANTLERVYWDITKAWDFPDDMVGFDKVAEVELFIENFRPTPDGPLQSHNGVITMGDETKSFFVLPNFGAPQTRIRAVELPSGSAVESDQGCADWILVNVGDERKSCTITNTVFFEGIPTLGQYGLAVLTLLMLGVGIVGYRRMI